MDKTIDLYLIFHSRSPCRVHKVPINRHFYFVFTFSGNEDDSPVVRNFLQTFVLSFSQWTKCSKFICFGALMRGLMKKINRNRISSIIFNLPAMCKVIKIQNFSPLLAPMFILDKKQFILQAIFDTR